MFASHTVAQQFLKTPHDHIVVDVGGELTELGIVRDKVLSQTITFPLGRHHVLRHVAEKLQVSLSEAGSLVRMHERGSLSETRAYEVGPVIMEATSQ